LIFPAGGLGHWKVAFEWTDSDNSGSACGMSSPIRFVARPMAFENASFASLHLIQLDPTRLSANGISQLFSLMRIKTA